ncbi:MAG: NAD(P)/FAD-dependent oxidoreductase [Actinomycetota bacterium]|nr:NAD(P)/FAD-dependent oxidoreductase [Actinomycetota bacterium]
MESGHRHRVVVIGGGFGGLRVVKALRGSEVEVTLVDRRNFHLFQPLTYQVATGSLSPSDVTYPLRSLFGSAPNVTVLLATVSGFDLTRGRVILASDGAPGSPAELPYDTLVVATGSSYSYFGHEEWREVAGEVKSLESAIAVRSRVLDAFERAEATDDPGERDAELTFLVVGGGPTGVEIAGQIGELARDTLRRDFSRIHSGDTRVLLVEMADRILSGFPSSLSAKAARSLRALGVTPTVQRQVVAIDAGGATLQAADHSQERINARTVIWAAGVRASALAGELGQASGAEVDHAGRVTVGPDLSLPGHPEVLALGDMVRVRDGDGAVRDLPGVAPVAIQQGAYAARAIKRRLHGQPATPFRYFSKGNLATMGRGRAVADLGLIRLSGLPAWFIWLGVHIWYLIGYQNRLVVMLRWSVSFLSHGRAQGSRIISDPAAGRDEVT